MKHRNSPMKQSSSKPSVSFNLNDSSLEEESGVEEVVHSPEVMGKKKKAGRPSKKQVVKNPVQPEKPSRSNFKTTSSPGTSKYHQTPHAAATSDENIDDPSTLKLIDRRQGSGRKVAKKRQPPKSPQVSSNSEYEVAEKRTRSKLGGASKENHFSSKNTAERRPLIENKRQRRQACSSPGKSFRSPTRSTVQSADEMFAPSNSSANETDELYTPRSNRNVSRGNRSSSIGKTPNTTKLSRSASRINGVRELENISANLSQRFSSLERSTPERIIQLAYEASANQSTSAKNTQTKKTKVSKRSQTTNRPSSDRIPSPSQNDATEFEARPQRPSSKHNDLSTIDLVIESVSRGSTKPRSPRVMEELKSPTVLQTPVKKTPSARRIQSLNIISSPKMSSLNVISEKRASSSSSSSSDEFSAPEANPAPSTELQPVSKKRKNSGVLDFSTSTKRMRTSAYSNDCSQELQEIIDTDTENDIEVATIPMKSGVKALEQSTVGSVTPGRFNPYLASPEDPFRAKQLLLNDKFRVLWLELAPQCIFTMRIYTPSTVMIVAGSITIKSQQPEVDTTLDTTNQVASLKAGALYHVCNSASITATYQLTETLNLN